MQHRSCGESVRFPRALLLVMPLLAVAACGPSDVDVEEAVLAQLAKDPVTAPLGLVVTVTDGVATITGETFTEAEQARALEITRAVAGVSEAVAAMTINEDAQLAALIHSALAADPALASVPIEVDAADGFVRLTSDATDREQRERAVAVASTIPGVTGVEDRMK